MSLPNLLTLPTWEDPSQKNLHSMSVYDLHSIVYNLSAVIRKMEAIFKSIGAIEIIGSKAVDVQGGIVGSLLETLRFYHNKLEAEHKKLWGNFYTEKDAKEKIHKEHADLLDIIKAREATIAVSSIPFNIEISRERTHTLDDPSPEESTNEIQEAIRCPLQHDDIFKINPHDPFQTRVFNTIKDITIIDEQSYIEVPFLINELLSCMITEGVSFKDRLKRMLKGCATNKTNEDGKVVISGIRLKL